MILSITCTFTHDARLKKGRGLTARINRLSIISDTIKTSAFFLFSLQRRTLQKCRSVSEINTQVPRVPFANLIQGIGRCIRPVNHPPVSRTGFGDSAIRRAFSACTPTYRRRNLLELHAQAYRSLLCIILCRRTFL
nr:uncharacterized protein LOC121502055 [Drosophila kikkawai]